MTFETFSIIWAVVAFMLAGVGCISIGVSGAKGPRLWLLGTAVVLLLISCFVIGAIGNETKDDGERREFEALGYHFIEVDTLFNYVVIDHDGRYFSCDYNETGGLFFVEPLTECRAADYGPKFEVVSE